MDIIKRGKNTENEPHQHKFYYMTTKTTFEPVGDDDSDLYRRVEYFYLMCNSPCNAVKRVVADEYDS